MKVLEWPTKIYELFGHICIAFYYICVLFSIKLVILFNEDITGNDRIPLIPGLFAKLFNFFFDSVKFQNLLYT